MSFMGVTLNLEQTRELLEFFGDAEADMRVSRLEVGHSGPGVYVWLDDYPEEGSVRLSDELDKPLSDDLWAWLKGNAGVAASGDQTKPGADVDESRKQ